MKTSEYISKILSICKIGLKFTRDPYARENYEELEKISLEMLKSVDDNMEPRQIYERDIYPTPNISVRVLVFNDKNEILMVKEKDDDLWSVPGGWCDVFESSSVGGVREVKQESGYDVAITRLLGVFQRERYKDYETMLSEYVHYYGATICGGRANGNHEVTDVRFFPITNCPPLSRKISLSELTRAYRVHRHHLDTQFD